MAYSDYIYIYYTVFENSSSSENMTLSRFVSCSCVGMWSHLAHEYARAAAEREQMGEYEQEKEKDGGGV